MKKRIKSKSKQNGGQAPKLQFDRANCNFGACPLRRGMPRLSKGFSLAEVLVISAVFLIVTMISLTIIIDGWKLLNRVETSTAQLRAARETLARVSFFLREADAICSPDDNTLRSGASSMIFTKNNDDLLNPAKEVWEFAFKYDDKTIVLKKYNPAYPNIVEVAEERIIGRDIDSFNFNLAADSNSGVNLSKLIKINIGEISKNIKTPDINLTTSVKLK